ncbi:MAG: T9SS type A sorting domain-containing protein, partial [Bacteroidota bacterium]|nr:T9SS type A sorting domain-containing protein [Bacteroidota bacterium]
TGTANGYEWSNGSTDQTIEVTEPGSYYVHVAGYCKTQSSDTIVLEYLIPDVPQTQQDTFSEGESAILIAVGDSIVWFDGDGNPIGTGSPLVLDGLTTSTTVFAQNLGAIDGLTYHVGPAQQQGNTRYNAAFVNGGLLFDVLEPIILEEVTLFTDSAGTRIIEIYGSNGFFFDQEVDLLPGETNVTLNAEIPIGSYTISTNSDQNASEFGDVSPILWRSSDGVNYPYDINNVVSITNSTFGEDFYYYFYDWVVITADQYCGSDLVPVTAFFDLEVATTDPELDKSIRLSPNPTTGVTDFKIQSDLPVDVTITSIEGITLQQLKLSAGTFTQTVDLTAYPAGTYIVRAVRNGAMAVKKLIKL